MLVNKKSQQELNYLLKENHFLIEDLIEKIYSTIIKKGDICVDGGAHIGRHTIPLATLVGEEGKVYAIEPVPSNLEILLIRLSKLHLNNTFCYQNALSNINDQQCSFYRILNLPQEGGLKKKTLYSHTPQFEEITTTTKTLDDILEPENSIRFMKLDLEGGEFNCLKGGLNTLIQKCPLIIFESGREMTARDYNYTKDDFFVFFEKVDYILYDLLGNEFTQDSWLDEQIFFYLIAAKRNSEDHYFLKNKLQDLLQDSLNSFTNNQFIIDHDIEIYNGASIDFTNSADTIFFHHLENQGFSGPESLGTWTQRSRVSLNFRSTHSGYFLLKLKIAMTFLTFNHNAIDVKVFLNQRIVDIWKFKYDIFDKQIDKYVLIDPEILNGNNNRIHLNFEIEFPASPQSLDVSSDSRDLGLLISEINCYDLNIC